MKKLLPAMLTVVLFSACEQKIETPAGGDKETTIVNPPAQEKKTETTVVTPPAAETKTDSTTTTTTTP